MVSYLRNLVIYVYLIWTLVFVKYISLVIANVNERQKSIL